MTVSPDRPQDGNRRPSSQIRDARRSLRARGSALPPILFQLPNLRSGSGEIAEEEKLDSPPEINETTAQEIGVSNAENFSEAAPADETQINRVDPPAPTASLLERVGTHAVVFGMIGLMVAGTIYIARNVNLPKKHQVVQEQVPSEPSVDIPKTDLVESPTAPTQTIPSIEVAMPTPNHGDTSDEIAISLSEPVMELQTPEFPANHFAQQPAIQAAAQPTERLADLPAATAEPVYAITSEAELQMAERSQKLAEQIARTEASIQDSLPDAPTEPLQDLADIAKAKADSVSSQPITQPTLQIPTNDKLDQELNAALESMKSEALPPLKAEAVPATDAPLLATANPKPAIQSVVNQGSNANATIQDMASGAAVSSQTQLMSTPASVITQPQTTGHPTTTTPAEPNTAIAEILKPDSPMLDNYASTPLPVKEKAKFAEGSMFTAQPVSSSEMVKSPSTPVGNSQTRTPRAVANWLKYLPPAPVKR